jgi:hypothetical protein
MLPTSDGCLISGGWTPILKTCSGACLNSAAAASDDASRIFVLLAQVITGPLAN